MGILIKRRYLLRNGSLFLAYVWAGLIAFIISQYGKIHKSTVIGTWKAGDLELVGRNKDFFLVLKKLASCSGSVSDKVTATILLFCCICVYCILGCTQGWSLSEPEKALTTCSNGYEEKWICQIKGGCGKV